MRQYDLNNLSLRDALEITRDMWNWLADNPGRYKLSWLKLFHPEILKMNHSCACCHFTGTEGSGSKKCEECPLGSLWGANCEQSGSPYKNWCDAHRIAEDLQASNYARQIANAAVLELIKLDEQDKAAKIYSPADNSCKAEQPKDPYAELKAAQKAGKVIQYKTNDSRGWLDCRTDGFPLFGCEPWLVNSYRIKPEPHYRPWKPEEVPVGALLRWKQDRRGLFTGNRGFDIVMLTGIHGFRILVGQYACNHSLLSCFENLEHSLDHGKTWLPCGVLIEE